MSPSPRDVKEMLYTAAQTNDAELALRAAQEFYAQQLWTSTAHYDPIEPDGTERLLKAWRPGTCALCHREFTPGTMIRWRSRVDCHASCWEQKFPFSLAQLPESDGGPSGV